MFFRRKNIVAEKVEDTAQIGIAYISFIIGFFRIIFDVLFFIFGTKKGRKWLMITILGMILLFVGFVIWGFSLMKYDEFADNRKYEQQFSDNGYYESREALVFKKDIEYFKYDAYDSYDNVYAATYINTNIGLTQQEQSVISKNKDIVDRDSIYAKLRDCHFAKSKSQVCRDAKKAYSSFENLVKNEKNYKKGKSVILAKDANKIKIKIDYGGVSIDADKLEFPRY